MDMIDSPQSIQNALLTWFIENGRHWIPWKLKQDGSIPKSGESISPYEIWIAEVMLQQTQLKTVVPYWQKWMNAFPSLKDLAEAEEHEVLLVWQGLGYYSRARRIHESGHNSCGRLFKLIPASLAKILISEKYGNPTKVFLNIFLLD